ncbi:MAG: transposase [Ignavibacterium sp.]|nr:MAG: transposase [Ignavibacterium sp.]
MKKAEKKNIKNPSGRRSIRLKEYDYANPNWYYVTICTVDQTCLIGDVNDGKLVMNELCGIVKEEWLRTKEIRPNIDLDYYIIIPNHIHGIIIIESMGVKHYAPTNTFKSPSHTLGAIVRGFKSSVTKRVNRMNDTAGKRLWQRNYYKHIIRNEQDLYRIRKYIQLNPLKWELDEYYKT